MFDSVLATLEKNTVLVITVDTELLAAVPSSFVIPWAVAHQAPLSIGFPKQEYGVGEGASSRIVAANAPIPMASHY